MKIMCTKKNLNSGLNATSKIISAGNTLPVLNNILLKTDGGRLKLSSTNLEIAINTWVGGKVEEEGEITVPARLINDYVNNLLTENITLVTEKEKLNIQAEKTKTHINGLPSEEFPLIPQVENGVYTKINTKNLQQAINETSFAAAFSETQPEISGVLFSFEGKNLTLAATDRYRLAEETIELEENIEEQKQVIVPTRAVNELIRLGEEGKEVEVFIGEGQIMFRGTDFELISRLIDGQYPDYKQIIPNHFTTEATIPKKELIQAIKATSLFASENNNVELLINPSTKQITMRSGSAQSGDSEINLDADIVGEKNSIIFNYRYILECLNNLKNEKIILKVIDSSSPAAIVPEDRSDYLYIVMPIKT